MYDRYNLAVAHIDRSRQSNVSPLNNYLLSSLVIVVIGGAPTRALFSYWTEGGGERFGLLPFGLWPIKGNEQSIENLPFHPFQYNSENSFSIWSMCGLQSIYTTVKRKKGLRIDISNECILKNQF